MTKPIATIIGNAIETRQFPNIQLVVGEFKKEGSLTISEEEGVSFTFNFMKKSQASGNESGGSGMQSGTHALSESEKEVGREASNEQNNTENENIKAKLNLRVKDLIIHARSNGNSQSGTNAAGDVDVDQTSFLYVQTERFSVSEVESSSITSRTYVNEFPSHIFNKEEQKETIEKKKEEETILERGKRKANMEDEENEEEEDPLPFFEFQFIPLSITPDSSSPSTITASMTRDMIVQQMYEDLTKVLNHSFSQSSDMQIDTEMGNGDETEGMEGAFFVAGGEVEGGSGGGWITSENVDSFLPSLEQEMKLRILDSLLDASSTPALTEGQKRLKTGQFDDVVEEQGEGDR